MLSVRGSRTRPQDTPASPPRADVPSTRPRTQGLSERDVLSPVNPPDVQFTADKALTPASLPCGAEPWAAVLALLPSALSTGREQSGV